MELNVKTLFSEWHDFDGAAYQLGVLLGLWQYLPPGSVLDHKWVFWTNNPLGNSLHNILNELVEGGILIERDDPLNDIQYKYNDQFDLST